MTMMKFLTTMLTGPLPWVILGALAMAGVWMLVRRAKRVRRQSRMLCAGLREIGEFAVEEARCTMVHCTKEPRRFFGKELPWMRERLIFTVDVVVKIGVDFDDVIAQVDALRRKITLQLPPLRILSAAPDYDSMTVLDEKTGVFAQRRLEWHRDAMQHLTQEAEERVRLSDAFLRAEESLNMRLQAFVGKLYDLTEYDLTIIPDGGQQAEEAVFPSAS